ncbi:MAG: 2-oxoacid:acceptor oxidoreductase family protein [Desulfovibrio sp.]|uniref:2-oxoacid:acceptor oxidoreductase family protein n=1 Tax=Desulfovibrio sp. 7SRBS1 TaxID=3378064 RepID=UPI003B40E42A
MSPQCDIYRFEIRLSGTGGQGIVTLGKILGHALALEEGYNVAQTQSYGPEARGGASRADLVISSQKISYPKSESIDLLVALSQEACYKFYRFLKPKGILLVDTGLVTQPPTNVYVGLPFTQMAMDEIKVPQAMNVIVLGAVSYMLPFVTQVAVTNALKANLPQKIIDLNLKAFKLGYDEAKKNFGDRPEVWCQSPVVESSLE